jgi:stage V sporulation protein AD
MASIKFNNVYIKDAFSIAGPLESDGQIRKFDLTMDDYYYKEKTFIDAEVKMQKVVIDNLLYRNKMAHKIDLLIGGDLSDQIAITNLSAKHFDIPFLGVYSACASFIEGLIIASNFINSKAIKNSIVITSSHNLNSERQFRFPIEYGAPKANTTTFTATGSVGVIVTNTKSKVKIESATIGNVLDYEQKDATNMGAVMAPSAMEVLMTHLNDLERTPEYYDVILTGDLGSVGSNIFLECLKVNYKIKLKNHMDAGCEIFLNSQNVYSGSSGPVTLPLVLFNKILRNSKYKKILVIATGSLHSKDTANQKKNIPSIAHAVSLEVGE